MGRGTFTVVPEDDLIVEADEVLTVSVTGGGASPICEVLTVSGVADLPVRPATMELLESCWRPIRRGCPRATARWR